MIFFYYHKALPLIQRFCSGYLLLVDATFNTNKDRFPLLITAGITNKKRTFPVAISYIPGETVEVFSFFFECLRDKIFTDGIPEFSVILSDQTKGLILAVDTLKCLPNSQLQFCNWHAVEAITAKFRKGGYTSKEVDGYTNDTGNNIEGLHGLCWNYVKSLNSKDLDTAQQALLNQLLPKNRPYINETWRPKESRVITAFTRRYRNLGANSTQRIESFHRIVHSATNGQLTLERSAEQLAKQLINIYTELEEAEDRASIHQATRFNPRVFRYLIGAVSLAAIKRTETK